MTNYKLHTSKDIPPLAKRKRVLAAIAQDIATSEDDDNVADSMDICDIIESHTLQPKETVTSHALHALGETIRNTLLEINEIREKNRERRHKELLDVLAKITHQTADSGKNEMDKTKIIIQPSEQYLNSTIEINENDYILKQTVSDEKPSNNTTFKSKNSTSLSQKELNDVAENTSSAIDATNKYTDVSPVHLITSKNSKSCSSVIYGKGQVNLVKGVYALKQDSKEELQKMRAQMLELQRKKMEDRERKKKELQQHLQNNG